MGNQMVFERYEMKYLMDRRQRDAVLRAIEPYMSVDEYGHSSIRNIYYDTPNFRLIRESLEKPVYKEKLRVRGYGPAAAGAPVFVELKKVPGCGLQAAHFSAPGPGGGLPGWKNAPAGQPDRTGDRLRAGVLPGAGTDGVFIL